jgi:hypothetical protein
MLRRRIFRLRGIYFRPKNSPAKTHLSEELSGEESSGEVIFLAKNYPGEEYTDEESGEFFFERRIIRRRIIWRQMFREPILPCGLFGPT